MTREVWSIRFHIFVLYWSNQYLNIIIYSTDTQKTLDLCPGLRHIYPAQMETWANSHQSGIFAEGNPCLFFEFLFEWNGWSFDVFSAIKKNPIAINLSLFSLIDRHIRSGHYVRLREREFPEQIKSIDDQTVFIFPIRSDNSHITEETIP